MPGPSPDLKVRPLHTVVPVAVQQELDRLAVRWRQLPLEHAVSAAPGVRQLVQDLADRCAEASSRETRLVPDLGPAVLVDQLAVMVYDCVRADVTAGLEHALVTLRRGLR